MKIDIYTLLGMIKDGKAPSRIVVFNEIMTLDTSKLDYKDNAGDYLFEDYEWLKWLDNEVEILETTIIYNQDTIENNKQDKIEKLNVWYKDVINQQVVDKINEIIDFINKEK